MSRVLAALTLVGLMAAVAVVGFNMPRPLLGSDRNRGERHERVSLAAIAALPTAVVALDVREIEQAIAEEYAAAHGRYVGGLAAAIAPDPTLTPGAVRTIDVGEICSQGNRQLRHSDRTRDDHIMAEYRLRPDSHPDYEIDHLIPLGIGGADSNPNLWPEPRRSIERKWNAETKDRLEWKLRNLICSGQLDVAEAQRAIAEDWIAAFVKLIGEPRTP